MRNSANNLLTGCLWLLMLAALFVAALAGRLWYDVSEFLSNPESVRGQVTAVKGSKQGSGRYASMSYSITVSFQTPSGESKVDSIDVPWPIQGGDVGETVEVLWNPDVYDDLRLDSYWGIWGPTTFVGGVSLLLGIFVVWCAEKAGQMIPRK